VKFFAVSSSYQENSKADVPHIAMLNINKLFWKYVDYLMGLDDE
jgi:hypothetical protein